ncbi:MAG: arsenite S-adenosylmethyltransferase, partial [Candidatus Omnitrophica bacterium]|nr:arsenite S-adenosylmethyltransferase [Candidatus Omnitrophota bacterium]
MKDIKKMVREGYAKIAKQESSCCAPINSCCATSDLAEEISRKIGYTDEEIRSVPQGANLGLGCGN